MEDDDQNVIICSTAFVAESFILRIESVSVGKVVFVGRFNSQGMSAADRKKVMAAIEKIEVSSGASAFLSCMGRILYIQNLIEGL